MWSELTYLVEKRCREAPALQDPTVHALIALYGALTNCQIAFERVESGESHQDQADAVLAMDVLFAVLHNLQPVMQLFDAQPVQELMDYLEEHERFSYPSNPKRMLKQQVAMLRRLLELEAAEDDLELTTQTAFTGARRELAHFIRTTYSPDDLFAS